VLVSLFQSRFPSRKSAKIMTDASLSVTALSDSASLCPWAGPGKFSHTAQAQTLAHMSQIPPLPRLRLRTSQTSNVLVGVPGVRYCGISPPGVLTFGKGPGKFSFSLDACDTTS
jgi:hypothetical protein